MVPEFDPSDNSQNIEWWIHKINECVKIYNWDHRQTCHYALSKLVGLAKKWNQGLLSVIYMVRVENKIKGSFSFK